VHVGHVRKNVDKMWINEVLRTLTASGRPRQRCVLWLGKATAAADNPDNKKNIELFIHLVTADLLLLTPSWLRSIRFLQYFNNIELLNY